MTDPPVVGASDRIREFWDADASTYDATKSHSISDPLERAAWRQALSEALPLPPASVLDVGAGTGSLSLLAAELGYAVTALDLSPGMLAEAERKANATGLADRLTYVVGSASAPHDERERVMAEVEEMLDTDPELRGRDEIVMPYRTEVFWCAKL